MKVQDGDLWNIDSRLDRLTGVATGGLTRERGGEMVREGMEGLCALLHGMTPAVPARIFGNR